MIGIFGGTFDPIHLGHCRVALELQQNLELEEIRFIPCKQPVNKLETLTSAEHRLAMLKLAIAHQPGFIVDDREIRRDTPSFMIETLLDLKKEMPDKTFGLILGSDVFAYFQQWKRWEEIIQLAKLIVVPRQYAALDAFSLMQQQSVIILQNITTLPISSTSIRETISTGKSARYLLPEAVFDYIQRHKLYR